MSRFTLSHTTISIPRLSQSHDYLNPTAISIPRLSQSHDYLNPTTISIPRLSQSHDYLNPTIISIPRLSQSHDYLNPTTISIPTGCAATNYELTSSLLSLLLANPLIIPPSPVLRLEIIKCLYYNNVKVR